MYVTDEILHSVSLPYQLPDEVFFLAGYRRRLPDLEIILRNLPPDLTEYIYIEATVITKHLGEEHDSFILTLKDGYHLRMRLEHRAIVELTRF